MVNRLIKSKADYEFYLEADRIALDISRKRPMLIGDDIWKFQRLLRKAEYIGNCKKDILSRVYLSYLKFRIYRLGLTLGFAIPRNVFGPGLSIAHRGPIVVNMDAKVGENCRISHCVTIGTSPSSVNLAPRIGNNVFIGPGAVIVGPIEIADGIAIGANSYVDKSFIEQGITIAGVPARKVSNKGQKEAYICATEILRQTRRRNGLSTSRKTRLNILLSTVRYGFFAFYTLLIARDQKYAHISLSVVVAIDRLFKFKFLKEYARRQHEAFSREDEKRIIELSGNRILEIGSGMGYWGLLFKDYGRVTIALEICDSYLRFAKMINAYEAVIKGSANALPIRPDCFDTALAIEVIEHVNRQNGLSLINEAERVSECVIITTPLNISGNENLPSWVPESEHHLSRWTEQELRKAGFVTTLLGRSLLATKGGKQTFPFQVR